MSPSYPHTPGHKGESPSGKMAAQHYAPKAGTKRAKVLEYLERGPATAEQISEVLGDHFTTIRPRLSELKAFGLAIETGRLGKGALGGSSIIWRLTTPEERAARQDQIAEQ